MYHIVVVATGIKVKICVDNTTLETNGRWQKITKKSNSLQIKWSEDTNFILKQGSCHGFVYFLIAEYKAQYFEQNQNWKC